MNANNKVMPNSLEAEQAVIASILIDNAVAEEIISHLSADDFYQPANKVILSALHNLNKKGQALDLVTLFSQLTDENNIEKAGGIEYISELVNNVPNAANADKYIEILKEKAILRIKQSLPVIGSVNLCRFQNIIRNILNLSNVNQHHISGKLPDYQNQ